MSLVFFDGEKNVQGTFSMSRSTLNQSSGVLNGNFGSSGVRKSQSITGEKDNAEGGTRFAVCFRFACLAGRVCGG